MLRAWIILTLPDAERTEYLAARMKIHGLCLILSGGDYNMEAYMRRLTINALNMVIAAVCLSASTGCGGPAGNETKQNNDMESLNMTSEWDKVFPPERQGDTFEGYVPQPLRHNACGGSLHAEGCCGADGGHSRERAVRGGEGAGVGTVCADAGRARIPDHSVRPLLYG